MSYRRTVLRELLGFFASHPNGILEADGLKCFANCPLEKRGKLVNEINQLLQEGLLLGYAARKVESGQSMVGLRLNPGRIKEISDIVKLDWKWIAGTIIAVIALLLALLEWLKPFSSK